MPKRYLRKNADASTHWGKGIKCKIMHINLVRAKPLKIAIGLLLSISGSLELSIKIESFGFLLPRVAIIQISQEQ